MHTSNVIICNREYKKRFLEEMSKTAVMNLNALGYVACRAAYDESEDWLEELIEVIYENHLLVKEHMAKHHPQIKVYDLEGTYLQWLDLRSLGLSKDQLAKLLHKEALGFLDEGYFFGEEGEGYERINIACPKPVLKEALNRMTEAINSVKI
jgi:bifunctional pyridoxal-dependent enzyme with beta-cystathionase and maltose regulon repressor activities